MTWSIIQVHFTDKLLSLEADLKVSLESFWITMPYSEFSPSWHNDTFRDLVPLISCVDRSAAVFVWRARKGEVGGGIKMGSDS